MEKAASKGHAKAQLNLTKVYMRGYKVKKNEKKAFQWATLAADQGIPEAQLYLGNMYIEGRGTRINTKKGVSLILEAKNQGYAKANDKWEEINLQGA